MSRLLLVRHTAVAKRWEGYCYGQLDVGLSHQGRTYIPKVLEELTPYPINVIIHSGLRRTRILAVRLAQQRGIPCIVNPLWQERDFGTWEGKSWDKIYKETGDAMNRMLTAPATFRPGGGETTEELRQRTLKALNTLPAKQNIVIITHGGPLAALLGSWKDAPVAHWPDIIPPLGSITMYPHKQTVNHP